MDSQGPGFAPSSNRWWMIAGRMKRLVTKALSASALDDILVPFLAGMIHVTIVVLVVIASVGVLGVNTASFVAALGARGPRGRVGVPGHLLELYRRRDAAHLSSVRGRRLRGRERNRWNRP